VPWAEGNLNATTTLTGFERLVKPGSETVTIDDLSADICPTCPLPTCYLDEDSTQKAIDCRLNQCWAQHEWEWMTQSRRNYGREIWRQVVEQRRGLVRVSRETGRSIQTISDEVLRIELRRRIREPLPLCKEQTDD
jgi:hypothetical protein